MCIVIDSHLTKKSAQSTEKVRQILHVHHPVVITSCKEREEVSDSFVSGSAVKDTHKR